MSIEDKPVYVYCVVKTAYLRKKNGEMICPVPFSNQFRVLSPMSDGRLYGEAYKLQGRGYVKLRGYVQSAGFSKHPVVNMANLRYRNIAGQRIPVTKRYRGNPCGWIQKDEVINAVAFCGGWMLTGKGWTKADWLQKCRDIGDYESMKTLVYAVISQTVKDYEKIVRKLQSGSSFVPCEFTDAIAEMRMIRKWFKDGDYLKIIEDSMTGQERLECLDKKLGVTEEWVKRTLSKRRFREP